MKRRMMGVVVRTITINAPKNGDTGSCSIYTSPVGEMNPGTTITIRIGGYRGGDYVFIDFVSVSGAKIHIGEADISGRDETVLTFTPTESGEIILSYSE